MKLLPKETITYKTKLKEEEIIRRISEFPPPGQAIDSGMSGSIISNLYQAEIIGQAFRMRRIISYRNSFLPIIIGDIQKEIDGTTLKVKMRLHPHVMIILCVWFGFLGFIGSSFMIIPFGAFKFDLYSSIPLFMLIFAYAILMIGFKTESIKAKKDLQKLFEADSMQD